MQDKKAGRCVASCTVGQRGVPEGSGAGGATDFAAGPRACLDAAYPLGHEITQILCVAQGVVQTVDGADDAAHDFDSCSGLRLGRRGDGVAGEPSDLVGMPTMRLRVGREACANGDHHRNEDRKTGHYTDRHASPVDPAVRVRSVENTFCTDHPTTVLNSYSCTVSCSLSKVK